MTELMGVTEHARAMATTAAALLLEALDSDPGLIAPLAPGEADPAMAALLGEIAAWARTAMGKAAPPVIWRILARDSHHYLEATWRKDVAPHGDGRVDGARQAARLPSEWRWRAVRAT